MYEVIYFMECVRINNYMCLMNMKIIIKVCKYIAQTSVKHLVAR